MIPIYATEETLAMLRRQFAYIFDETPTGNLLPGVELHAIDGPFDLFGLRIVPGSRDARQAARARLPFWESGAT